MTEKYTVEVTYIMYVTAKDAEEAVEKASDTLPTKLDLIGVEVLE